MIDAKLKKKLKKILILVLKALFAIGNYLILRIIQDLNILGKKQLFMNSISNPSLNHQIKMKVVLRNF